jgi:hypothetical protein
MVFVKQARRPPHVSLKRQAAARRAWKVTRLRAELEAAVARGDLEAAAR